MQPRDVTWGTGFALLTRVRSLALVAVLAGSAAAQPVATSVGLGLAEHADEPNSTDFSASQPGLTALVGYRVTPHLALGAHFGATRLSYASWDMGPFQANYQRYELLPFDLAPGVQYENNRAWFVGWMGMRVARVRESTGIEIYRTMEMFEQSATVHWQRIGLSFGITLGFDVWRMHAGKIGLVFDVSSAPRPNDDRYAAWMFGASWRR